MAVPGQQSVWINSRMQGWRPVQEWEGVSAASVSSEWEGGGEGVQQRPHQEAELVPVWGVLVLGRTPKH